MFDINRFKQSLAQTIAYCTPRFTMDDPVHSARTLLKPLTEEKLFYYSIMPFVNPIIRLRACMVDLLIKNGKLPLMLPEGLAGGRLLGFDPDSSLTEGACEVESEGFLDWTDAPACDTWVYGDEGRSDGSFIIAWIPASLHPLIDRAITVSSTECINWLDVTNYNYSFLPILRSEGLI